MPEPLSRAQRKSQMRKTAQANCHVLFLDLLTVASHLRVPRPRWQSFQDSHANHNDNCMRSHLLSRTVAGHCWILPGLTFDSSSRAHYSAFLPKNDNKQLHQPGWQPVCWAEKEPSCFLHGSIQDIDCTIT